MYDKNRLYIKNGKLTGNHPILFTNKWLTEVDFNNIDCIDVKDSDKVFSDLILFLIFTNQLRINKARLFNTVYCFYHKNSEYVTYEYDTHSTSYHLMDENFNVLFWCDSYGLYGDNTNSSGTDEYSPHLYSKIIDRVLNKDELIINYMS